MAKIWLHDLPAFLESRGLQVVRYPGWELRSRSTGGFDAILGIGFHHDAVPEGVPLKNRLDYAWQNASARPIGNMWLHSDGVVHFGAAGAANTMGKMNSTDDPIVVSKGVIDSRYPNTSFGNRTMIAIEASNSGVGEVWPEVQTTAYAKLGAALCEYAGLDPLTDIIHHHEYTDRKIDPAGPTPGHPSWGGLSGANEWGHEVRLDIQALMTNRESSVKTIDKRRLYDSRPQTPYSGQPTISGQVMTFGVGNLPGTARIATIRVTTINPDGVGWVRAWGNTSSDTADHNYNADEVDGSTFEVDLRGTEFSIVFNGGRTHFTLDLVSWET